MSRRPWAVLSAAALSAALLLPLSAQALTVEQAGQLLEQFYVDPVPPEVLEQATIPGMIDALGDPYTRYFTPEEYDAFLAALSDPSVVGIGVVCQYTEQGPLAVQVFPDSPAGRGGLQAGDIITHADGTPLAGLTLDQAVDLLRGEVGTSVRVTFLREGQETTVELIRDTITVPTTHTALLDGHIGYIDCDQFGLEAGEHFREGITQLQGEATVWIVDLRDNSGGYTTAAAETAACFAGPGNTAILRDGQDHYSTVSSDSESLTLCPVIVLVNENSASASELFANSIRDRGAGIVIGERTFGKGVVQTVLDQAAIPNFFPEGDGIKITSHRFFSPNGNTNDQLGVIPNLLVPPDTAPDVARLLAGPDPAGNTEGYLRVDLDWRWYVDLTAAQTPELAPAFQTLLSALPPDTVVRLGTGGPDSWEDLTVSEAAQRLNVALTAPHFPDTGSSTYEDSIALLRAYGLVNGDEAGLFHPDASMTRAELAQLLSNLLGADDPNAVCPFDDVPADAWYYTAAANMAKLGLVNGVGDRRFDPEGTVTHQQFITILGRLAAWMNLRFYDAMAQLPPEALDMPELAAYADWARPWVWLTAYSQHNLLWAPADSLEPLADTHREEAAYALCQMLSTTGILPG